jgi:hypothetical protein
LSEGLEDIAGETQAVIGEGGDEAMARLLADESLRGEGLAGGAQGALAGEVAAAQGSAARGAQAFRGFGALQSAGYESFANSARASRQVLGAETAARLAHQMANQLNEIQGQITDVRASRGPLQTQHLLELRQMMFENKAAAKALGLDKAALKLEGKQSKMDQLSDRADRRTARKENRRTRQMDEREFRAGRRDERAGRRFSRRDDRRMNRQQRQDRRDQRRDRDEGGSGSGGKFTPTQRRAGREELRKATSLARSLEGGNFSQQEVFNYLVQREGHDPVIARAAVQQIYGGGISSKTQRQLRSNYGISVGSGGGGGGGGTGIGGSTGARGRFRRRSGK